MNRLVTFYLELDSARAEQPRRSIDESIEVSMRAYDLGPARGSRVRVLSFGRERTVVHLFRDSNRACSRSRSTIVKVTQYLFTYF